MSTHARLDIQFLRAFAVLAVIAYHLEIAGFGGGFVGVDIFFVISGYLIFGKVHAQLAENRFSLKRFFEARVRRIFPALAVLTVAASAWGWFYTLPRDYLYYSRTALAALLFLSNHAFMGAQGYFDAATITKPLLHTWSLAVEGQFYFWLPLLMLAAYKLKQGARIGWLLAFGGLFSLGWALWLAYREPESGFYFVAARAWEFAFGALCSMGRHKPRRWSKVAMWLSLAVSVASVVLLKSDAHWPNLWTLLPVVAAAAFLYFGPSGQHHPAIANPAAQLVGDMSYSLYLWHWPVWVYAYQWYGGKVPFSDKLLLLALIFALSYASWRWVERPFRERGRISARTLKYATGGMLVATAAFTAFIVANKGYSPRFPDYIARVADQTLQTTPRRECFRFAGNVKDAPEQFCAYGASNRPENATSMLWGDSFANMYLTAVSDASRKLGITGLVATMSGCQPAIESDVVQYPGASDCKAFNREVYGYLQSHPEIHTVLLGRIWWDYGGTIGHTEVLVRELLKQGRKVVLVGPTPNPGVNVETEWATRQIKAGQAIDEIGIEATPGVKQRAIAQQLESDLAAEIAGGRLVLVDPVRHFCDERQCYLVRDGIAIFRDEGHLTELSAQKLEPVIRDALNRK